MLKKIFTTLLSIILLFGAVVFTGCVTDGKFTVTFDPNGGTLVSGELVQVVSSASEIEPPVLKMDGYSFERWDKIISKINKDTTVKAQWKKDSYFEVTFDGNGGRLVSGFETQRGYTAGDIIAPVYERTGYTLGWSVDVSKVNYTTTITAKWTPKEYTVLLDKDGGAWTDGNDYSTGITATYGQPLNLPTATKEGFKYSAWKIVDTDEVNNYDGLTLYNGAVWQIDKDNLTLKINWMEFDYSISYDLAGGVFEAEGVDGFNADGETFNLVNPVRKGYKFLGWSGEGISESEPQLEVEINPSETAKDLTYKAHWEVKKYTINFDVAGGKKLSPITISYGDSLSRLPIAVKDGFVFDGWTYEGLKLIPNSSGTWEIDKDGITLVASYYKSFIIAFNLSYKFYDANGSEQTISGKVDGLDSIARTNLKEGVPLQEALKAVTNPVANESDKYLFISWIVYVNGKETTVTNEMLANDKLADNGIITIHAKYSLPDGYKVYTIKYNLKYNGMSVEIGGKTTRPDMLIVEGAPLYSAIAGLGTPTEVRPEDYEFVNWVYDNEQAKKTVLDRNSTQVVNSSIAVDGVITIYASCSSFWIGPY